MIEKSLPTRENLKTVTKPGHSLLDYDRKRNRRYTEGVTVSLHERLGHILVRQAGGQFSGRALVGNFGRWTLHVSGKQEKTSTSNERRNHMNVDPRTTSQWSQYADISHPRRQQDETPCQIGFQPFTEGLVEEALATE